jgi:hypothetical protein
VTSDKTKELLEQMLAELYERQAETRPSHGPSYLEAVDGQFLGKITNDPYDRDSILNEYGPYGSPYSTTSIFNEYSDYGSQYGNNSVNNPYCSSPPRLYINGRLIGPIGVNPYVPNRVPTEAFLYSLQHDMDGLLAGRIVGSESEARQLEQESFIEAGDGTFLGKLNPNRFDQDSIFNRFGAYGNKFSSQSIFNKFSTYGNQFNSESPFNRFSTDPPRIYVRGKFVAYLTKNTFKTPRVDPDELLEWAEKNVPRHG